MFTMLQTLVQISNPGTQYLPYKTVYYALSQATSGDVVDFDTITGGTGGTPGTYDITQTSTTVQVQV